LKGVKKLDLRNNDLSPEQKKNIKSLLKSKRLGKEYIKSLFKDRKEEVEIIF
jgi:hypothetical protein